MKISGCCNGRCDEIERMAVPIDDRAAWFGGGVCGAACCGNHSIFHWQAHLDRFYRSSGCGTHGDSGPCRASCGACRCARWLHDRRRPFQHFDALGRRMLRRAGARLAAPKKALLRAYRAATGQLQEEARPWRAISA